jgi:pentalenolactone synthase
MTEATEATEAERVRRVTTPVGDPAWLVSRYDLVRSLLADPRLGRTHPNPEQAARFSEAAFFSTPEQATPEEERTAHARFRRLLARSFSARRMERLRPRIMAITTEMLDALEAMTPPVDFHEAVSFPLPALVISELLGVAYEDRDDFRRWSDDAAHMDDGDRSTAGLQSLFMYMYALIERKREKPGQDVISDLLAFAQQDASMTEMEVAQLGGGLLFAGHITTVNAIDEGVYLFLTHPDQREALVRNPSLVPSAIEEILRYPDPARSQRRREGGLPRYAAVDIEVDGVTIPAGDLVLLSLEAANSDEATFPDACSFDPARTDNPHMTFGHGSHYCIGAPLARMELECVFGTLFNRFPTLELAVPPQEIVRRTNVLAGGFESLPVRW